MELAGLLLAGLAARQVRVATTLISREPGKAAIWLGWLRGYAATTMT